MVDAVKVHLRVLTEESEVSHFGQNAKRLRLVETALHSGGVTPRSGGVTLRDLSAVSAGAAAHLEAVAELERRSLTAGIDAGVDENGIGEA